MIAAYPQPPNLPALSPLKVTSDNKSQTALDQGGDRYNADQNRKDKSVGHDHVPKIANTSPVDCISLPDIVLNIDETERFESSSEDEI